MEPQTSLLPSSSAAFAWTLDQNVTRDVSLRIDTLAKRARNAGVATWVMSVGAVVGTAALVAVDPFLVVYSLYFGGGALIPFTMWLQRSKATGVAKTLDQSRDVACVGPDGLLFFSDDGFFVERAGGWQQWGVLEPEPRHYDSVEHDAAREVLVLRSSHGWTRKVRVPRGWTTLDTARVEEKMKAFAAGASFGRAGGPGRAARRLR